MMVNKFGTIGSRLRTRFLAAAPQPRAAGLSCYAGRGLFSPMSAIPPESGHRGRAPQRQLWATNGLMHCSIIGLFDHIVGEGEQ